MKNRYILYKLLILSFICNGCSNNNKENQNNKNNKSDTIQVDRSVTVSNAFNDLFLDSARLQKFLDNHPEYIIYQSQYFDFYKQRNYEYAWFDTSGISEEASNFMNLLNTTIIESNDSSLYNRKLIALYSSFVNDSTKHEQVSSL